MSWVPTILNMLEHVPCQSTIVTTLLRYVSVCWMPLPYLIISLCRDMCYTDKGFLSQYAGVCNRFISYVGQNGQVDVLERLFQTMPFLSLNLLIFVSLI